MFYELKSQLSQRNLRTQMDAREIVLLLLRSLCICSVRIRMFLNIRSQAARLRPSNALVLKTPRVGTNGPDWKGLRPTGSVCARLEGFAQCQRNQLTQQLGFPIRGESSTPSRVKFIISSMPVNRQPPVLGV